MAMEQYWAVVSNFMRVVSFILEGYFVFRGMKPFLSPKRQGKSIGITYMVVMLLLYVVPVEIYYPRALGMVAALAVMYLTDRRNPRQKLVLGIVLYFILWIAGGMSLLPRQMAFSLWINKPFMLEHPWLQWGSYLIVEGLTCVLDGGLLYGMVTALHKEYRNKAEEVSGRELALLLILLFMALTGYLAFVTFSDFYLEATGKYIWNEHRSYTILQTLYQAGCCLVIFLMLIVYQQIKEKQQEEKEAVVLAQQLENVTHYIEDVEELYRDIRGLKHDMGNHIAVLESLYEGHRQEELETYLSSLKESYQQNTEEIRTGNPVTDVILNSKKKEAAEKGIVFVCDFYYPTESKISAFDVSVLLNNAIANAMEGTVSCSKPYIRLSSYRRKNVYFIEIENRVQHPVEIAEDTGLPSTTKTDGDNHGFGLRNMRKIAQKYYGDIAVEQKDNMFQLSIMLML